MSLTTSAIVTPVVIAPSVPQSISMCASSPPTPNVIRKQSPSPCRYMRDADGGQLMRFVLDHRSSYTPRCIAAKGSASLNRSAVPK